MAQILYFGKLKDAIGKSTEKVDLPTEVNTTEALRNLLEQEYGAIAQLFDPSIRIAVNGEIVSEPFPVADNDEVAFLPPVGGG